MCPVIANKEMPIEIGRSIVFDLLNKGYELWMLVAQHTDVNPLVIENAEDRNRFLPYRSMCRRVLLFSKDLSSTAGQVKCDQGLEFDLTCLRPAQGVCQGD